VVDFNELRERYEQAVGFPLFLEEGEALDFQRKGNTIEKPVCGIYSVNPITMTAIQTPFMGIVTVNMTFISPPDRIDEVREKLDTVAAILNGTAFTLTDADGVSYSISYNCQTCAVGDRILDVALGCGEVFPVDQAISYVIVERGVSAYDASLWIDGLEVPILTLVENNVHATTVYPSQYGAGRTSSEMESYGIDFTTPYVKGRLCEMLRRALNDGSGNQAHCVVLEKAGERSCRLMQFANTSNSISPPQNIGFNISMTELDPTAAELNGEWSYKEVSGPFASVYLPGILIDDPTVHAVTVFWGDGHAEHFEPVVGTKYHIYADGDQTHKILVFKAFSDALTPVTAGMSGNLVGKYVQFLLDTSSIDGDDVLQQPDHVSGQPYEIIGNGESGNAYRAIYMDTSSQFWQRVSDTAIIPVGGDRNDTIPNGLRVQIALEKISHVSTLAKECLYIQRKDLAPSELEV
jgi:hypothetical protein